MRASADHDLSWYFGTGSATRGSWASASGLRSTLGSQLDVMRAGLNYEGEAVDPGAVEDAMLTRIADATYARRIEARLRQLDRRTVDVLRLHYGGGSFPGDVDPSAVHAPGARALCVTQVQARLTKVDRVKQAAEANALEHLVDSLTAGGTIAPELLRQVLRDASVVERATLCAETAEIVTSAQRAYEGASSP